MCTACSCQVEEEDIHSNKELVRSKQMVSSCNISLGVASKPKNCPSGTCCGGITILAVLHIYSAIELCNASCFISIAPSPAGPALARPLFGLPMKNSGAWGPKLICCSCEIHTFCYIHRYMYRCRVYQQHVSVICIHALTACVLQPCLLVFGFGRKVLSLVSHGFDAFGFVSVILVVLVKVYL